MGGPSSNVRVVARIRPLAKYELENGSKKIVTSLPNFNAKPLEIPTEPEVLEVRPEGAEKRWFELDAVLDGNSTQEEAYIKSGAKQAVTSDLFKGFNCTILAYGQTGAGKTFTMGSAAGTSMDIGVNDGIIPRACVDLFSNINSRCDGNAQVELSYLEIYNEEMRDLLSDEKTTKPKELKIRETLNGEVYVGGLSSRPVDSPKAIGDYMEEASSRRAVASTKMNAVSSRSHAICVLRIKGVLEDSTKFQAKLTLVDLAGSERIKKTGAEGGRRKEGININKGLFVLGQVVSALSETRPKYKRKPPYRDSKLTRLLQDSLGGNSRTIMVACVSPADFNLDETVTTLRYATNARNIKNTATRNVIKSLSPEEAAKLQRQNQLLSAQVKELQETIRKMGAATDVDVTSTTTASTADETDDDESSGGGGTTMSQQKARIKELEDEVRKLKLGSTQGGINESTRILTESMAEDAIELPCLKKKIAELEEEVSLKKEVENENMELQTEIQELKADADSARLAANKMSKIMEQLKDLKGDEIDKKRMEFDHIKVEEAWVSFVYQVLETNRQHLKKLHFDFMVVAREVDSPEFGLNQRRGLFGRLRNRMGNRNGGRSPHIGNNSSHGLSNSSHGITGYGDQQIQRSYHGTGTVSSPSSTEAKEEKDEHPTTPPEEDPTNIMKVIVNLKDELKAAHEVIRQQRVQVECAMQDKEERDSADPVNSKDDSDVTSHSDDRMVPAEDYRALKARYSQLEIDRCWAEFQLRDRITNDALKFHRRLRAVMQKSKVAAAAMVGEEAEAAREEEIKTKVDSEIKNRMRTVTDNLRCFEERMIQMESHVTSEMNSLGEIRNSLRVQQDNLELEIGKTEIEHHMLNKDDNDLLEQLTTLLVGPVKNLGSFGSDDFSPDDEDAEEEVI